MLASINDEGFSPTPALLTPPKSWIVTWILPLTRLKKTLVTLGPTVSMTRFGNDRRVHAHRVAGGIDRDGRDRVAAIGQGLVGRDAPGIIGIGDALTDHDRRGAARRLGVKRDRGAGLAGRAEEVGLDDIGDIVRSSIDRNRSPG